MNRPAVIIEKRKPLTRREALQLMLDQLGRCKCGCGEKLQPLSEGIVDEHRVALALGGTNDLSNRELWRKPCAATKTATKDAPAIAKVRRIEARENGTRRERKPIQSRGFGDQTRNFAGAVVPTRKALRQAASGTTGLAGYEPKANEP